MAWGAPRGIDDLLDRIRRNDASLTSLCLFRGRRFNEDDAMALCAALESNTVLRELSISSHPVGAASAAAFARMLAANSTLRSLDLGNGFFGDEGLAALAPGIAASASLRTLNLESKSITAAGCAALAAALASSRPADGAGEEAGGSAGLEELLLGRNNIGASGLAALLDGGSCGGLRVLDLSGCDLQGAAAVQPLAAALQQGQLACLQQLRLDGNELGADGAAALAAALSGGGGGNGGSGSTALQELYMQRCSLGAEGVAALAAALQPAGAAGAAAGTAAALTVLDLSGNAMGSQGASALADALAAGAAPQLRKLLLCGTGLNDASTEALANALAARPADAAATAGTGAAAGGLALDLSGNSAGPAAVAALAAAPLSSLCLHDCKLGGDGGSSGGGEAAASAAAELARQLAVPGTFSQLRELDISANRLEASQLLSLLAALTAAPADADGGSSGGGGDGAAVSCPRLRLLVIAANPGAAEEAVSAAVERLQEGRPALDVVRRAADTGEGGLMR